MSKESWAPGLVMSTAILLIVSTVRCEDSPKESALRAAKLSACIAMVSISFDAVTSLSGMSFTLKGVLPGKVHRVTRGATTRSDLHMM